MVKFTEIERVFVSETPSPVPFGPFSTILSGTTELASISIGSSCDMDGILIIAVVNWSATVTPIPPLPTAAIVTPPSAQASFEILLNGTVVYRETQTIVIPIPLVGGFLVGATPITAFNIASLLHFDTSAFNAFSSSGINTYTLRATNVILNNALDVTPVAIGTTTANAGPVTFVVQKVEAHREDKKE